MSSRSINSSHGMAEMLDKIMNEKGSIYKKNKPSKDQRSKKTENEKKNSKTVVVPNQGTAMQMIKRPHNPSVPMSIVYNNAPPIPHLFPPHQGNYHQPNFSSEQDINVFNHPLPNDFNGILPIPMNNVPLDANFTNSMGSQPNRFGPPQQFQSNFNMNLANQYPSEGQHPASVPPQHTTIFSPPQHPTQFPLPQHPTPVPPPQSHTTSNTYQMTANQNAGYFFGSNPLHNNLVTVPLVDNCNTTTISNTKKQKKKKSTESCTSLGSGRMPTSLMTFLPPPPAPPILKIPSKSQISSKSNSKHTNSATDTYSLSHTPPPRDFSSHDKKHLHSSNSKMKTGSRKLKDTTRSHTPPGHSFRENHFHPSTGSTLPPLPSLPPPDFHDSFSKPPEPKEPPPESPARDRESIGHKYHKKSSMKEKRKSEIKHSKSNISSEKKTTKHKSHTREPDISDTDKHSSRSRSKRRSSTFEKYSGNENGIHSDLSSSDLREKIKELRANKSASYDNSDGSDVRFPFSPMRGRPPYRFYNKRGRPFFRHRGRGQQFGPRFGVPRFRPPYIKPSPRFMEEGPQFEPMDGGMGFDPNSMGMGPPNAPTPMEGKSPYDPDMMMDGPGGPPPFNVLEGNAFDQMDEGLPFFYGDDMSQFGTMDEGNLAPPPFDPNNMGASFYPMNEMVPYSEEMFEAKDEQNKHQNKKSKHDSRKIRKKHSKDHKKRDTLKLTTITKNIKRTKEVKRTREVKNFKKVKSKEKKQKLVDYELEPGECVSTSESEEDLEYGTEEEENNENINAKNYDSSGSSSSAISFKKKKSRSLLFRRSSKSQKEKIRKNSSSSSSSGSSSSYSSSGSSSNSSSSSESSSEEDGHKGTANYSPFNLNSTLNDKPKFPRYFKDKVAYIEDNLNVLEEKVPLDEAEDLEPMQNLDISSYPSDIAKKVIESEGLKSAKTPLIARLGLTEQEKMDREALLKEYKKLNTELNEEEHQLYENSDMDRNKNIKSNNVQGSSTLPLGVTFDNAPPQQQEEEVFHSTEPLMPTFDEFKRRNRAGSLSPNDSLEFEEYCLLASTKEILSASKSIFKSPTSPKYTNTKKIYEKPIIKVETSRKSISVRPIKESPSKHNRIDLDSRINLIIGKPGGENSPQKFNLLNYIYSYKNMRLHSRPPSPFRSKNSYQFWHRETYYCRKKATFLPGFFDPTVRRKIKSHQASDNNVNDFIFVNKKELKAPELNKSEENEPPKLVINKVHNTNTLSQSCSESTEDDLSKKEFIVESEELSLKTEDTEVNKIEQPPIEESKNVEEEDCRPSTSTEDKAITKVDIQPDFEMELVTDIDDSLSNHVLTSVTSMGINVKQQTDLVELVVNRLIKEIKDSLKNEVAEEVINSQIE